MQSGRSLGAREVHDGVDTCASLRMKVGAAELSVWVHRQSNRLALELGESDPDKQRGT